MAQIYKLVVAKGQQTGWLQLPKEEQKVLWEKVEKKFQEVGGQRMMAADSSWSSEEHPGFFVEIFPDIEALQKFTTFLNEMNFLQYFNTMTVVGTPNQM